jgi:hypothetical protein
MFVPRPTERSVDPNAAAVVTKKVNLVAAFRAVRKMAAASVAPPVARIIDHARVAVATAGPTAAVNMHGHAPPVNVTELDRFTASTAG